METTNDLYEDAIMDCCTKHEMPEFFQKLGKNGFKLLKINNKYLISAKDNEKISFTAHDTENFPGVDLISDKLSIVEVGENDSTNYIYGQIIVTYHQDIDRWTFSIHLKDDEKEVNRLERIAQSQFISEKTK